MTTSAGDVFPARGAGDRQASLRQDGFVRPPAAASAFTDPGLTSSPYRRSDSVVPPQIPNGSRTVCACVRHCSSTGQVWQIRVAKLSRYRQASCVSPSGERTDPFPCLRPSRCLTLRSDF